MFQEYIPVNAQFTIKKVVEDALRELFQKTIENNNFKSVTLEEKLKRLEDEIAHLALTLRSSKDAVVRFYYHLYLECVKCKRIIQILDGISKVRQNL